MLTTRETLQQYLYRHAGEYRHPVNNCFYWIPAFAGMTNCQKRKYASCNIVCPHPPLRGGLFLGRRCEFIARPLLPNRFGSTLTWPVKTGPTLSEYDNALFTGGSQPSY